MRIDGLEIKPGLPPFVVCEIGAAHNGLLDRALTLMEMAKRAGADACKIQCFSPDTITFPGTRPEFTIQAGPWMGRNLYDLYGTTAMPREWYPALFDRARELSIPLFASVFSREDILWMERLRCPAYKIASCEIVDVDLIEAVGVTGKPIIISTGMAVAEEIEEAMAAFLRGRHDGDQPVRNDHGFVDFALLHCVSAYPTPADGAGMLNLRAYIDRYPHIPVGFSDHTIGWEAAVAAAVLGATIIEKHMTLSRDDGGEDDHFASTPEEFTAMVKAVQRAHSAMKIESDTDEMAHLPLRRSLYVVKNIKAGERFTRDNLRSIRPANGLHPRHLATCLNMRARVDVPAGMPMSMDFVERV